MKRLLPATLVLIWAACGGADLVAPADIAPPGAHRPEPVGTEVATARGVALMPEAWPVPAGGHHPRSLADGVIGAPAFMVDEAVPPPHDFVFAVDDAPYAIAAVALWIPEGVEADVAVSTSVGATSISRQSWASFQRGATSHGEVSVVGSGALPLVVTLPGEWLAHYVLLSVESASAALVEVSVLSAEQLSVARGVGGFVVHPLGEQDSDPGHSEGGDVSAAEED